MKEILLIQTGGTISMDFRGDTHTMEPDEWERVLSNEFPELSTIAKLSMIKPFFEDSSDINPVHWATLSKSIADSYDDYDGFVILHGTDTMAYTASALSFSLQNLAKPVILTGSQVPMTNIRSDARRNLVNAIEMATTDIPEVAICFNDHVFRGNRSTKMSIGDFDAFASPNFPPLAEIGLHIEHHNSSDLPDEPFSIKPDFDTNIFYVKVFPGLDPDYLLDLNLTDARAVIIEAFGSGNFPVNGRGSFEPFLAYCNQQDLDIVITSQAPYDAVDLQKYTSGRLALEYNALGAGDMTQEATLTKLMHLYANYNNRHTIRELFTQNMAGELSINP